MPSAIDYVNLFSLLAFPASDNGYGDVAVSEAMLKKLKAEIFQPKDYDATRPPTSSASAPVEVYVFLQIEHIDTLKPDAGTVDLHGNIVVRWRDDRIRWNATKFGGIDAFSAGFADIAKPWFPPISCVEVPSYTASRTLLQRDNDAEMYVTNKGYVYARAAVTLRPTCNFDFSQFPYDVQNCSLVLYTTYYKEILVFGSSSLVRKWSRGMSSQYDGYSSIYSAVSDRVRVGPFMLTSIDLTPLFIYNNGAIVSNVSSPRPYTTRSILRAGLKFERNHTTIWLELLLPLYALACVIYAISLLSRSLSFPFWMGTSLSLLAVLLLFITAWIPQLPTSFKRIPLVGVAMYAVLVEWMLLFGFECLLRWRQSVGEQSVWIGRGVQTKNVALVAHSIGNTALLILAL